MTLPWKPTNLLVIPWYTDWQTLYNHVTVSYMWMIYISYGWACKQGLKKKEKRIWKVLSATETYLDWNSFVIMFTLVGFQLKEYLNDYDLTVHSGAWELWSSKTCLSNRFFGVKLQWKTIWSVSMSKFGYYFVPLWYKHASLQEKWYDKTQPDMKRKWKMKIDYFLIFFKITIALMIILCHLLHHVGRRLSMF